MKQKKKHARSSKAASKAELADTDSHVAAGSGLNSTIPSVLPRSCDLVKAAPLPGIAPVSQESHTNPEGDSCEVDISPPSVEHGEEEQAIDIDNEKLRYVGFRFEYKDM